MANLGKFFFSAKQQRAFFSLARERKVKKIKLLVIVAATKRKSPWTHSHIFSSGGDAGKFVARKNFLRYAIAMNKPTYIARELASIAATELVLSCMYFCVFCRYFSCHNNNLFCCWDLEHGKALEVGEEVFKHHLKKHEASHLIVWQMTSHAFRAVRVALIFITPKVRRQKNSLR